LRLYYLATENQPVSQTVSSKHFDTRASIDKNHNKKEGKLSPGAQPKPKSSGQQSFLSSLRFSFKARAINKKII